MGLHSPDGFIDVDEIMKLDVFVDQHGKHHINTMGELIDCAEPYENLRSGIFVFVVDTQCSTLTACLFKGFLFKTGFVVGLLRLELGLERT